MIIYSQHKVSDQDFATTQRLAPDFRGSFNASNSSAVGTEERGTPAARVVGTPHGHYLMPCWLFRTSSIEAHRSPITSPNEGDWEHRGQMNCILDPYPDFSSTTSLEVRQQALRRALSG